VASGAATNGHPALFGTFDGVCYVSCDVFQGWGCSNTETRTVTMNGSPLACGYTPIPAAKTSGFNVIDVSAADQNNGGHDYASLFWWGTWSTSCTIPATGLDF
jgi:hypothetical protein